MFIRLLLKSFILFTCTGLYFFSAIKIDSSAIYNILVDAGAPIAIIWPFETAIVGNEGERGLRIGPKIGRGWRGEAGGEATYRFYVSVEGKYYIWVYALWYDDCSNAIFAKIDDMDKNIMGNDPIYQEWHWVRSFDIDLQKGTHTLTLSNHSDNIALQKVFLTNSSVAKPEYEGRIFSNIFYEGFDGCDQGNFIQWKQVCGNWQVLRPFAGRDSVGNVLAGSSVQSALIILENSEWSNYSVNVSMQSIGLINPEASIGICFGVRGEREYYLLEFCCVDDEENAKVTLRRKIDKTNELLADFVTSWKEEYRHEIQIDLGTDEILVHIDEQESVSVPITSKITGGIGLCLEGKVSAYFDDIHVRHVEDQ